MTTSRRGFLRTASTAGPAMVIGACGGAAVASGPPARAEAPSHAEVTPNEDLMREHGIIHRLLLVYEEGARRLERGDGAPIRPIAGAASIVRRFVEDYHERQEEELVFPAVEEAGGHAELVATLRRQHEAGRTLTDRILDLTAESAPDPARLVEPLRAYVTMYRPHSAREDTVLFPAFRESMPAREMEQLAERFEEMEHQRLGEGAFERTVGEVAELERELEIEDLAQFTPDVAGSPPEG